MIQNPERHKNETQQRQYTKTFDLYKNVEKYLRLLQIIPCHVMSLPLHNYLVENS